MTPYSDAITRLLANPLADDLEDLPTRPPPMRPPRPKTPRNMLAKKRSVRVDRQQTSIHLNDEYWEGLRKVARKRGCSVDALVTEVAMGSPQNLSMALRALVNKER